MVTGERIREIVELIMSLADTARDCGEELEHNFTIRVVHPDPISGYPPGTTAATVYISPGYEYSINNDGSTYLRYKHRDIRPEQIRPGREPADISEVMRTMKMSATQR